MPQISKFDIHADSNGTLVVFEQTNLPFHPIRTFIVKANEGQLRGKHAHRSCSQFLVVLSGVVRVSTEGSCGADVFILNSMSEGLHIPPLTWATQEYLASDSILMVLCDEEFSEPEYIRSYSEFRSMLDGR